MSITLHPPGADIFASGADAIVIPCNAVGVPGKGLALLAAKRYPGWARTYKAACRAHTYHPGHTYPTRFYDIGAPNHILTAIVKDHWRDPSRLAWVEDALCDLRAWASSRHPRLLAVPALGCGLGSLAWQDVHPLAVAILGHLDYPIHLYAPHEDTRPR